MVQFFVRKVWLRGADGEWIYFDMVPEEHEVRTGAAEYTGRICVIGSKLDEHKLEELFDIAKIIKRRKYYGTRCYGSIL